jgi:ATP sulfurylase
MFKERSKVQEKFKGSKKFNLGTIFQMKNHSIGGDVQQVQGVQRKFKMFKEVQMFKKSSRVQIKQKKSTRLCSFLAFWT